ncbi:SMODS domain-containing nucleotidyltransferase [Metabacillus malikii]|uniref:Nucleotidyltransferase n=1 Tax=Metabacillus malikii TaxID=1504265 RepID=A0ABT9ZFA9_9BACI|nr:nucleotidyltransferase [Metabacillus malikii]MDQ0230941.1 hypothetical protein [Metabacillus malikii]
MKLNDHFKKFVGNISLNPTRVEQIDRAVRNWEKKFKGDEEIKDHFISYFTQGSYSTDTGVRPKSREEFDVDVVLVLDIVENDDPKENLHWIKDRIKSYSGFENRVKVKDRCVRIEYAKEFHVDVVPAFQYENHIKIPSRKEGEWVETNPEGFTEWCNNINDESDKYFSQTVKILKHWRDEKVGEDTAPKSILLTTLVGNAHIKKPSIAETLVETLKVMVVDVNSLVSELENDEDVPWVDNPSLEDENLARTWSKLKAQRFLKKLTTLRDDCQDALDEKDKDKSIEKWQAIFGSADFPSSLGETENMARNIAIGTVMVNSKGHLNREEGTTIKEHRFYGEGEHE